MSESVPATRGLCPGANQGTLPSSEFAGEQQAFHCLARDQRGRPAPDSPAHVEFDFVITRNEGLDLLA